jgi:hypothetical protein
MAGGEDGALVVGLLTDPGVPAEVARGLAEDLPEQLSEQLSSRVCWKVKVALEPFEVAPHPERISTRRGSGSVARSGTSRSP